MKIAITADPFIPVPPQNYGGIERVIHFLCEELQARGHDVRLVAHADSKVSVPLLAYPAIGKGAAWHLGNLRTIRQLKAWKPDVIHSFSRLAYLAPFLRSPVPKLMSYQREPTLRQIRWAAGLAKAGSLHFTGCSGYIADQIRPFAPAYPVFNGIDLSIYPFQPEVGSDAPLVFLGRIEPIKGTHNAIEAAQRSGRRLVIAGNLTPGHQAYFDQRVKPHLNERIQYIGPVNDAQKAVLLGAALAFLMPIEWNEPFGIVMAEALACGTPVLGYGRGAVKEVVRPGINGFAVNTMDELVAAIGRAGSLARSAVRADAEARFSSRVIVDQYFAIYQQLAARQTAHIPA